MTASSATFVTDLCLPIQCRKCGQPKRDHICLSTPGVQGKEGTHATFTLADLDLPAISRAVAAAQAAEDTLQQRVRAELVNKRNEFNETEEAFNQIVSGLVLAMPHMQAAAAEQGTPLPPASLQGQADGPSVLSPNSNVPSGKPCIGLARLASSSDVILLPDSIPSGASSSSSSSAIINKGNCCAW